MATNIVIEKILKQITRLNVKLTTLRNSCPHNDYEKKGQWNDHDGWSQVERTWYENRKCNICDKDFTVQIGKDSY